MTSKPPRKTGYALNRADYVYHIMLLIDLGLRTFLTHGFLETMYRKAWT